MLFKGAPVLLCGPCSPGGSGPASYLRGALLDAFFRYCHDPQLLTVGFTEVIIKYKSVQISKVLQEHGRLEEEVLQLLKYGGGADKAHQFLILTHVYLLAGW